MTALSTLVYASAERVGAQECSPRSSDHVVCSQQDRLRNCQAQVPGGREVNRQLKLRGLLERHVGWFSASQDLVDILGSAPKQHDVVDTVDHQATRFDEFRQAIDGGQSVFGRQRRYLPAVLASKRI